MSEGAVQDRVSGVVLTSGERIPRVGTRIDEIDGIRGWAALAVVIFHLWLETFGKLHTEFIQPSYWFFTDGPMAVYIFFILSGDALSTPFFFTKRKAVLDKMVVKRYFRLAIPIFIVTLATVIAIWLGLTSNVAAARIVHREDWLGRFVPAEFNALDALMYPFFTVFGFGGNTKGFNAFLWTMPIELCGSLFVFLYLYVHEQLKYPKVVLASLIGISILSINWYALFFIGVFLSYLRSTGTLDKLRPTLCGRIVGPLLVLSAYALEYYLRSRMPLETASNAHEAVRLYVQHNDKFILATLFVTGSYVSVNISGFFRNRLSRFLGTLSFPIYLVQLLILCTFSSYLITRFASRIDSAAVCLSIAFAGVVATLICGYLLSVAERRMMRLLDIALSKLVTN
uniref:Acyltransferase 3 n=1 Tax=Burkholderia sp. (strain CCGE1003) TaxID=640512 RepID=E1TAB5_BURSG